MNGRWLLGRCSAVVGEGDGVADTAELEPLAAEHTDQPQVTSLLGTITPIVLRRATVVPRSVWEFAKFFGSGVSEYTLFPYLFHSLPVCCSPPVPRPYKMGFSLFPSLPCRVN